MNNVQIKSLGIRTDIMFFKFQNNATQKSHYIVLQTPHNPRFFWGNLIVYPGKLTAGCFEKWIQDFKNEFQHNKEIEHVTLCWEEEGDPLEIKKFTDIGYDYTETVVLIAERINISPVYINNEVTCRRITSDLEWQELVEYQVETNTNFKEEEYRPFIQKRFDDYRKFSQNGHGHWYGAFHNGKLVSDLGLFWEKDFARFQNIMTREEFRKKGISQTLINFAVQDSGRDFFVIETDEDGPALNMYKSIGFESKEKIHTLCYYDKKKWNV